MIHFQGQPDKRPGGSTRLRSRMLHEGTIQWARGRDYQQVSDSDVTYLPMTLSWFIRRHLTIKRPGHAVRHTGSTPHYSLDSSCPKFWPDRC